MTCLETTFLIDLLEGESGAVAFAESLDRSGERATVTPVAAAEVWVGASLGGDAELSATELLLRSLTWLDFSRQCARLAGAIQADLRAEGNPIGVTDCMIAAIAMQNGEAIVTRDGDFDRIEGLELVSY